MGKNTESEHRSPVRCVAIAAAWAAPRSEPAKSHDLRPCARRTGFPINSGQQSDASRTVTRQAGHCPPIMRLAPCDASRLSRPNLLAMILFEKFGQHQPLNRQTHIAKVCGCAGRLPNRLTCAGGCGLCLSSMGNILERQFEDRPPSFINDNQTGTGGSRRVATFTCGNLAPAARRFLCCFLDVSEFESFLVKDSQLTLFDVKEISGHSEDPAIFDKATIFGTSVVNCIKFHG